jgi:phosphohistidine phosphatase
MKELILIRHAKSSWDHPDLDDLDRPLNLRGEKDAPIMGKRLKKRNACPDIIITSPAVRAFTTANIIAREIGFPVEKIIIKEIIYKNTVVDLLELIHSLENNYNRVFLVGHNPAFSLLTHFLGGTSIDHLPTMGICGFSFNVTAWQEIAEGIGTLLFFDSPKNSE